MNTHALELRAGPLRLALRPDLGGSIAGLWRDEVPVLRSVEPASLEAPRLSGCFPLVPYSNRLGYRRFRWNGQDHTTLPNFDSGPHSVHGVAWLRPWAVLACDGQRAELAYRHTADGHWPFDFEVRQRLELEPAALTLRLEFVNRAAQSQPAGVGWHPCFPKRARSRLHVELAERWDNDATGLPVRRVAQPGIDADLAYLDFDNCFEGWRAPARIRDERLALRLTSSLPYLVVYTPPLRPYFCVEPVSHVSNALHMAEPEAHGLRALAPGDAFDAWMRLEVAAA